MARESDFVIVDDFYFDRQWQVFEQGIRAVLPSARIFPLDVSHPVFNSFFKITTLDGNIIYGLSR